MFKPFGFLDLSMNKTLGCKLRSPIEAKAVVERRASATGLLDLSLELA